MGEAEARELFPCRYQRNLGTLGADGQQRLLAARATVVGLGGLGGLVLEELARMGVGCLVGIDPQVFEESNLNRQILCTEDTLGVKKVDAAARRMAQVNGAVTFTGYDVPLADAPAEAWAVDIVFDCLDNAPDRLALAQQCTTADVPLVHGAIGGWCGQVAVIRPGRGELERLLGTQGEGLESREGTPAFTAALAASLMVAKGTKILAGREDAAESRTVFFDLLTDEWETMS